MAVVIRAVRETDRPLYRAPCGACATCDVRTMAVCAALADDEVEALESIMTATHLQANEMLVQEGDPRSKVFTLTSGMLRLSVGLPDGRRQITGFLLPGDYLGLADDEIYTASAEAVGAAALCAFPVRQMDALVERFPKLKDRLHRFTRAALRQARENQLILGRLAPVEKLASFLVLLSDRAVEHRLPASPVSLPMPRADIADYLGLTVETVSRSFTKLRNQGLVAMPDPHSIEICDRRALAAVAGLPPH
ncbi:Crp/Fnr family transcriptional regulator [Antarcticirhabdus aurantiaca]|uniref:Crp/Fnr family transcriptional regulator n=1 Tax=Antarcticirhabdus aurantiaca TaxID=2606717 RepID=A0ACD4NJR9_9HYPH|nr:Crp/Fnr family transcriptional regulator [Antarcticirhabdus aurantiaca]WAJ27028.1 Crp/Fnr family transcriptional regulator [Jeongeuplla avenae]